MLITFFFLISYIQEDACSRRYLKGIVEQLIYPCSSAELGGKGELIPKQYATYSRAKQHAETAEELILMNNTI